MRDSPKVVDAKRIDINRGQLKGIRDVLTGSRNANYVGVWISLTELIEERRQGSGVAQVIPRKVSEKGDSFGGHVNRCPLG
jgi:hypothetical protein